MIKKERKKERGEGAHERVSALTDMAKQAQLNSYTSSITSEYTFDKEKDVNTFFLTSI